MSVAIGDSDALLPSAPGRIGPFPVNGAYYALACANGGGEYTWLRAFKATTPTSTWAAQDAAEDVAPIIDYSPKYGGTPYSIDCVVVGNVLHIVVSGSDHSAGEHWFGDNPAPEHVGGLPGQLMMYARFDCSSNTWTLSEEIVVSGGVGIARIAVRSNGDVIVARRDTVGVTYYQRTTAWGAAVFVDSTALSGTIGHWLATVLGASDRVHIVWKDNATSIKHRSLASNGGLDATTSIATCDSTSAISPEVSDGTNISFTYQMAGSIREAHAVSQAAPSWTTGPANATAPSEGTTNLAFALDPVLGERVTLWARGSDKYLYYNLFDLSTWGADTQAVGAAEYLLSIATSQRANNIYMGIVYDGTGKGAIRAEEVFLYPMIPVCTVNPVMTGTMTVGSLLSCTQGTWTGATSYTYQWLRNGATIAPPSGTSTYTLTTDDPGAVISCRVAATNTGGTVTADSNGATCKPYNVNLPTINGSAINGRTLASTDGDWLGAVSYARAWRRDGTPVDGQTDTTYAITDADVGHVLDLLVTATNAGGDTLADSADTSTVIQSLAMKMVI